ncbi:MAG: FAD-dependent monooxygenase [Ramlibacter sp.]|nr:FAD-dependent monooxygenase [Ramlibacter sp.]
MTLQALVVGGGIGGLAAAIACTRAGWEARLYEQAPEFSEVGAGIQLGPNATRILDAWGLGEPLEAVAATPQRLVVRNAADGAELSTLRLGAEFGERYGAPYLTIHRADLQGLLLAAARERGIHLKLSCEVTAAQPLADAVRLRLAAGQEVEGDALVAADGLWSALRGHFLADGEPRATGHLAYRSLAGQARLPAAMRSQDITVWLGPRMHLVSYPVSAGERLNVVAIVQGAAKGSGRDWDQAAVAAELRAAAGPLCAPIADLLQAMPHWRLWPLYDRAPLRSADEMARGRVALLGDAAHPMRPYLAQGAAMAVEDAAELGRALSTAAGNGMEVPLALRRYALNRWRRCARVQARARRNGEIFHATGWLRQGRDWSLRLLGARLLDQPWLYR